MLGVCGGLRAVQPGRQDLLVGRGALGPLPEGTLLNIGLVGGADEVIPPGRGVVGVSLEPGAAPTPSLAPGDRVDVLRVNPETTGSASPSASTAAQV